MTQTDNYWPLPVSNQPISAGNGSGLTDSSIGRSPKQVDIQAFKHKKSLVNKGIGEETMIDKILLTVADVQALTGYSRSEIYGNLLAPRGNLSCLRVGRSVRIPAAELLKFIERNTQSGDMGGVN